jgi:hypothetical protein
VKSVAVLLVSVVVIGLIVKYCLLPLDRMPDYVLGDDRCDLCGQRAVYKLLVEDRYLVGEYCSTHRWIGIINSDPLSKLIKVLLGAAVFGVIHSAVSLLAKSRRPTPDDGFDVDPQM